MNKNTKIMIASLILALGVMAGMYFNGYVPVEASVFQGHEYYSTTTTTGGGFTGAKTLKKGLGSLGSVIVSSTTVGTAIIYDATTTNALLRGNIATTSLSILAQFGASPANGTYQYDSVFSKGILVDLSSSFSGAYTITWR